MFYFLVKSTISIQVCAVAFTNTWLNDGIENSSQTGVFLGCAFCIFKVWRATELQPVPPSGYERIQVSELFQGRRSLMNTPWAVCSSISICYYKTISLSPDAFLHTWWCQRVTGLSLRMHDIMPPASSQTPTSPSVNILLPREPDTNQLDRIQNKYFCHISTGAESMCTYMIHIDFSCKEYESTV